MRILLSVTLRSMSRERWNASASRRWTTWFAVLGAAWAAARWLIVPAIIRSAYEGGVFGFLAPLMPGRFQHPVDVYLERWATLAAPALLGLAVIWVVGLVFMQPITWQLFRAAYLRLPTFGGRWRRRTVAVMLAATAITVVVQAIHLPDRWEEARGHEYERIATSLAAGEGFSFPPTLRWLVLPDEPQDAEYGATAWKEPIYPSFMAAAFVLFGEHLGKLVIALVQLGFLLATCYLIYRLGEELFTPGIGVAAALMLVALPDLHWLYTAKLQTHAISSLLLVGGLLMLLRYADRPGMRRAAWLGMYLGLAMLTHAVLAVLVPIAALFVLVHGREGSRWDRLKPAIVVCVVAALAISPWTLRNYVVFGHVIPVQTGFGLFSNVSNSFVAESYLAELDPCGDGSDPLFRADGPLDAVLAFRAREVRINDVHERAVTCVAERHGREYFDRNEHGRDGFHRRQLEHFIAEHPAEFVQLAAAKAALYIFDVPVRGRGYLPLAVAGLTGMLVVVRRRRMWVFPVTVLAYAGPFALGAPMYYRYQAPLTPVYALFAILALATLFRIPLRRLKRRLACMMTKE